jgi:hypothetical protein
MHNVSCSRREGRKRSVTVVIIYFGNTQCLFYEPNVVQNRVLLREWFLKDNIATQGVKVLRKALAADLSTPEN